MSDRHITLLGTEDVTHAARTMASAAEEMRRAANEFETAVHRLGLMLDEKLVALRAILSTRRRRPTVAYQQARAALERLLCWAQRGVADLEPIEERRPAQDGRLYTLYDMIDKVKDELAALDKPQETPAEPNNVMSALSAYYNQRAEEDEIRARKDEESALAEYYMLSELSAIRGDLRIWCAVKMTWSQTRMSKSLALTLSLAGSTSLWLRST